jgi:hypothetical protein
MNYYPDALKAIVSYIEALNAVDKTLEGADDIPYLAAIPLTDAHQTNYGKLVDEIGGLWSWVPPEATA